MSARANATNNLGTSQVSGGQVATTNTAVTTFPRAGGVVTTVLRANGQGANVGDTVERDSDGGFWDVTTNVPVSPEFTSIAAVNSMLSLQ